MRVGVAENCANDANKRHTHTRKQWYIPIREINGIHTCYVGARGITVLVLKKHDHRKASAIPLARV